MPINFQTLRGQINEMTQRADLRIQEQAENLRRAKGLLAQYTADPGTLNGLLERAIEATANLNTALPTSEPIAAAFDPPEPPANGSILAVDGSQIFPDRHRSVYYSLINLGAISVNIGSGETRQHETWSRLLYDEDLYIEASRVSQRYISLIRDLAERVWLVELAADLDAPVLTLTDGPIELWGAREGSGVEKVIERKFEDYLGALRKLKDQGVLTAGYIDKTGSDLVARMLGITVLSPGELKQATKKYPFTGLSDAGLFEGVLAPFQRSAVFAMHTLSSKKYTEALKLHFFYLNVGKTPFGKARLARVDIPRWVAEKPESVARIHALLVNQCRILGQQPYPYLLHRAHEIALVTFQERDQVDNMIRTEMLRSNLPVGYDSAKSGNKRI